MVLPSERLSAYIARIRPLIGVCPFVYQQIVALRELTIAKFTDELFLRPRRTSRCPKQSPIEVGVHLRRSRRKQGTAGTGKRETTVRWIVWKEAGIWGRIGGMGCARRVENWRPMGQHQGGGVCSGHTSGLLTQLELLPLVRHHGHQFEAGVLANAARIAGGRRFGGGFGRFAAVAVLAYQFGAEQWMNFGGIKHWVHVARGDDRNEGGGLAMVRHGGG